MTHSLLLDQVRAVARLKQFSLRTEESYAQAIRRFILFHDKRHPASMGTTEIQAYLTHLAVEQRLAGSTINVALSAICSSIARCCGSISRRSTPCRAAPELQWGRSVLGQSFRNPVHLAKMVASLQFFSGGRYILGIGAGAREDEYLAYGYDFPAASAGVEQIDEALQIMKALWTQERVSFAGKHYQVSEAWCEPKPDPLPTIMVGAFKPKMLRLTAKHADWWNVSSTGIADYRQMVEECERACAEVGRDPATLRRTWGGGYACAPTEQHVAKIGAARPLLQPREDFIGTPEQLLEQMQPFVELGVDYFMLDCQGFPDLTTATMLVHEVLLALNRE